MLRRWLVYLATLAACVVFYVVYQEWLSTVVLWWMIGLPLLSLAVSLPSMLQMRLTLEGASAVTVGTEAVVKLAATCPLPRVPFRGRLRAKHLPTGKTWTMSGGGTVPTAHSGGVRVEPARVWVFDYLGLFAFPVRLKTPRQVVVRPAPLPTAMPTQWERLTACMWRPKLGGGYAEQHEIRPYREGDNLSHIHWKATAKTGRLMLREPLEPARHRLAVTLDWCGSADEIDRKGGRLRFVGTYLIDHGLSFDLIAQVRDGALTQRVVTHEDLLAALDTLLCCEPTAAPRDGTTAIATAWQCHIGGEPDED